MKKKESLMSIAGTSSETNPISLIDNVKNAFELADKELPGVSSLFIDEIIASLAATTKKG